ncbi:MAG: hypothetical protein NT099_07910 [Candidatus Saganbacteria bacterium]|nr:hypothetical protein [Candidatus Saganbacteria bacterium]
MFKKISVAILVFFLFNTFAFAESSTDKLYLSKQTYQHSKLELVTKKRLVRERENYSNTDITTTTYSVEASYSRSYTNIATANLARDEDKEITNWYLYKGGVRELSDLDFVQIIGDPVEFNRIMNLESQKANWRMLGGVTLGIGIATMIGGAALGANQSIISGGALATVAGFFISAFNFSPAHYIQPDYAMEKVDEYNLNLKKKLGLPVDYE